MRNRKPKTLAERIIKDFHHKPFLQRLYEFSVPKQKKKGRKVNETPMRSFLKTMGFRAVEIILDTFLLLTINPEIYQNLIISIAIEGICWLLSFIWERLWNLTDFGREVKTECPHCKKEIELCAECEGKSKAKLKKEKKAQIPL